MNILVTGAAGFIGFHVCRALSETGQAVTGMDNLNSYYEVTLKQDRIRQLQSFPNFKFKLLDLADSNGINHLFEAAKFTHVIHLGAQAGVRYSIENPKAYIDSNVYGTLNILEGCRRFPVWHLVYASSSSVYGLNTKTPFSVADPVNHPISLYAATKKSTELMAHTYSHLYAIPTTGLRFFTVYGPWGRPDMAPMKFAKAVLAGRPIDVYNYGKMERDFTYIDDVVAAILKIIDHPAQPSIQWDPANPDPGYSSAPYRLYNIGNRQPVNLLHFIALIEKSLGIKAQMNLLPMQSGDVVRTFADMQDMIRDFDFHPVTDLEQGIPLFIDWYKSYYGFN
ncbi:MAG: NAD-dependent epimerase [Proteobacteria bacterium]|nr:NAD-dependent epimerase [Pseudomonadota bacterium]